MENKKLYSENAGGVSLFSDRKIRTVDIRNILSAISFAPSNANAQPWEVIFTESIEDKKKILQTLMDSQFRSLNIPADNESHWLLKAPLVFILSLDKMRAKAKYGGAEAEKYGWIDIGSACQNLLLKALTVGVKGTIIREFDSQAIAEHFSLPSHVTPALMLGMGYSDETPLSRPFLTVDDYVHYQSWYGKLSERE